MGDVAGVPASTLILSPFVKVLFVLKVKVPIVVEALIKSSLFPAPSLTETLRVPVSVSQNAVVMVKSYGACPEYGLVVVADQADDVA